MTLRRLFIVLCLAFVCQLSAAANAREAGPNVLFFWIDTLRADHLGCYGYGRNTSPNIDQLASESVLFANNYTPHTVTMSSFMSITTSLYPFSHGVLHIAKDRLSPKIKTLPEILRMYGYNTVWYGPGDDPHLAPEVGFGRGFNQRNVFVDDLAESRGRIMSTLDQLKGEKFFLNIHTYHVHAPYVPSLPYRYSFTKPKELGLFESLEDVEEATIATIKNAVKKHRGLGWKTLGSDVVEDLEQARFFSEENPREAGEVRLYLLKKGLVHKYDFIFNHLYESKLEPDNPEHMEYAKALYDAEILELDTEIIGPILDKLKELGIFDETIIIICADHGEEFGEHGGITHGETLYEEAMHVPWIVKLPGKKGAGLKVESLSQTVDIMPTLLGVLGIPAPAYTQGVDFSGGFEGGSGIAAMRKSVYGQMPWQISIRSGKWKLQFQKGSDETSGMLNYLKLKFYSTKELYDLSTDPEEQRNLYSKNNDKYNELYFNYQDWDSLLSNYQDEIYEFTPNIDRQTREKIKKTGYW